MKHNYKKVLKTIFFFFREAWAYKHSYFFMYFTNVILKILQPYVNIFFPKMIIEELLGTRDLKRLLLLVSAMVIFNLFINSLLVVLEENIKQNYNYYLSNYLESTLGHKIMKLEYKFIEDKETLDNAEKARMGVSDYSDGVDGVLQPLSTIISNFVTILGTSIIIFMTAPVLLIIMIISVIVKGLLNSKVNNIQVKYFSNFSEANRGFKYVLFKLTNIAYAKDIRLYNSSKLILEKADMYNNKTVNFIRKQNKESIKYQLLSYFFITLQDSSNFLYLGYLALKKFISIGDFTMLMTTSSTFSNALNSIIIQFQELVKNGIYAYEYVKFMEMCDLSKEGKHDIIISNKHTIEFKNVYFAYPRNKNYVLKNISLKINTGDKISVVGLNGAGKTTFIKLLCRLYTPNKGEILLDGKSIYDYKWESYEKLISVVFQDITLVPFSIKENITVWNNKLSSEREVNKILKEVGLLDFINSLSKGIETPLYKPYDETGIELSGGQAQKLAIARALYKNAPIVILDEPTSALDPIAEFEIYKSFNTLIKDKTAIYISHRLSSCKFCDKIIVFNKGEIVETGTHNELINYANGLYAEMFKKQAIYYDK